MSLLDTTATYIAKSIKKNHQESASEEVLIYTLVILINTIAIVLIVSTVGMFTGHFVESIIALSMYALLRYFSGGVHLNTSLTCMIVSSLILISIAHTPITYWYSGFILNLISFILILWLAPKGLENVSRIEPRYYPLLKVISAVIICSNFIIQSDLLCLVFITQAISLTTPAHQLVDYLEGRVTTQ